ncbi:MAG TPA: hypothetical protein VMS37_34565 [Verrucomicrobiae bacterium]|nr:hypothetical protein [Verrucomicrobiae bacterium]
MTAPDALAQYRATLDRFADERAQLDSQLALAQQRGETARAANLYRYWQQIVARQRQFLDHRWSRS